MHTFSFIYLCTCLSVCMNENVCVAVQLTCKNDFSTPRQQYIQVSVNSRYFLIDSPKPILSEVLSKRLDCASAVFFSTPEILYYMMFSCFLKGKKFVDMEDVKIKYNAEAWKKCFWGASITEKLTGINVLRLLL